MRLVEELKDDVAEEEEVDNRPKMQRPVGRGEISLLVSVRAFNGSVDRRAEEQGERSDVGELEEKVITPVRLTSSVSALHRLHTLAVDQTSCPSTLQARSSTGKRKSGNILFSRG